MCMFYTSRKSVITELTRSKAAGRPLCTASGNKFPVQRGTSSTHPGKKVKSASTVSISLLALAERPGPAGGRQAKRSVL